MTQWYREDLAYIHDIGHSDYAIKSALGILNILAQNKIHEGLIVDLGCGSGRSALEFTQAGYCVLGVDLSAPLIAIAQTRVPDANFRVESLFQTDLPACHAVTSIGECLNYLFDPDLDRLNLVRLFDRIYNALIPGGVLIFDIAEPGQVPTGTTTKGFSEGNDWVVLVEKTEAKDRSRLIRRIVTFRQIGEQYRRSEEVHYLQLYAVADIAKELERVGFHVQVMRSYGSYDLPTAHAAFIACKPILS
jgi:SAM-dependent methyltransferase